MPSLRLRAAEPDDTPGICALLGAVFPDNPKRDPDVYAWQYWDNPFGPPSVWIWEDDGRPVAHGGVFATPGQVAGAPALLGHAADSATASAYRGRQLFAELAAARYRRAGELGMPATLSLPNPNSLPGTVKAGLVPIERVVAWVRPLDDAWLAGRARLPRALVTGLRRAGFKALPGSAAEVLDAPPAGLGELWSRVAPGFGSGVARSPQWWQWRYARNPTRRYGYVAVRRGGRLAAAAVVGDVARGADAYRYVFELLAEDAGAARAALGAACALQTAAVAVALIALPGSPQAHHAAAGGFRRLPRRWEPQPMTFGVIPHTDAARDPARLRWQASWGDHDHV